MADKMTIDEQIQVMCDFRDGKKIGFRPVDICGKLEHLDFPTWNFGYSFYATIEPREMSFDEVIDFIKARPEWECKYGGNGSITTFSALWYNEDKREVCNKSVGWLQWREDRKSAWKKFII